MGENKLSPVAYAHSPAIMKALVAVAQNWRHYIAGGYDFLEKPAEHLASGHIKSRKEIVTVTM